MKPIQLNDKLFEQVNFFGNYKNCGWNNVGLSTFCSDGALWNPIAGGAAPGGSAYWTAYYWLTTYWFNKTQRYSARTSYLTNGYSQSAVNNLAILTLGSGFEYTCKNKTKEKQINDIVKKNNWHQRSIQTFKETLIDGETFIYVQNNDSFRTIDPDLVYTSTDNIDTKNGVINDADDQQKVTGYEVHLNGDGLGEELGVDQVQHRTFDLMFGQKRGFSWLLPILSDLAEADKLTNSLMYTASTRAKFALHRKHNSTPAQVQAFKSQIQALPINQNNNQWNQVAPNCDNVENYNEGTITDSNNQVEYEYPPDMNTEGYIAALDASLRKIAARMRQPVSLLAANKDDMAAYTSELVSNSYLVRQIESLQHVWSDYELQLLEMCDIDTSDVQVICPEVALVDKKAEQELAQMLIKEKMCSKKTLSKNFGLDFEKEQELIKQEEAQGLWDNEQELEDGNKQQG